MKYKEYLQSAKKHLNGCKALYDSYNPKKTIEDDALLELYYLSGYILEGVVVYAAYKHYEWEEDDDIRRCCNEKFTEETGLDFYGNGQRYDNNGNPVKFSRYVEYNVQHHNFQKIVKGLLYPEHLGVPYLDDTVEIDEDVKTLIDMWQTQDRYRYKKQYICQNHLHIDLNEDLVGCLIDTCEKIVNDIQTKV